MSPRHGASGVMKPEGGAAEGSSVLILEEIFMPQGSRAESEDGRRSYGRAM